MYHFTRVTKTINKVFIIIFIKMLDRIVIIGGNLMAKAGMRRPDPYDKKSHGTESNHKMHHEKNAQTPVPEIQGLAKTGNAKAGPVNAPNWARKDYNKNEK